MSRVAVADLLKGTVPVDSAVAVAGWLRSRRSSKGGFSFLALHDGSAFDAIQVVADQALPNYEAISALGPGCAVAVEGTLVASQGKGQSVEIVARAITILGEVDDPATYPGEKGPHLRVPAHRRAPAAAHEHLWRPGPGAGHPCPGHSWLLRRARVSLGEHAPHYRQRLRGRRGTLSGQHP